MSQIPGLIQERSLQTLVALAQQESDEQVREIVESLAGFRELNSFQASAAATATIFSTKFLAAPGPTDVQFDPSELLSGHPTPAIITKSDLGGTLTASPLTTSLLTAIHIEIHRLSQAQPGGRLQVRHYWLKPSVELDEAGEEREVKGRTFFKLGAVFDVEQTQRKTGQEPPEVVRVIDQAFGPNLLATLEMVAADRGITLKASPKNGMHGANGFYTPVDNTITRLDSLPSAQRAKTLAHGLGHSILHGDGYNYRANRPDAELEAESVAYLVCGSMGLDSKTTHSAMWLAGPAS
jgi:hypothetical protein